MGCSLFSVLLATYVKNLDGAKVETIIFWCEQDFIRKWWWETMGVVDGLKTVWLMHPDLGTGGELRFLSQWKAYS